MPSIARSPLYAQRIRGVDLSQAYRLYPLSDKGNDAYTLIMLHHRRDGCGCCCGLRAHVTGEKLLWPPEFTSGQDPAARSSPSGQFCRRWRETAACQEETLDGESKTIDDRSSPMASSTTFLESWQRRRVPETSHHDVVKARGCMKSTRCVYDFQAVEVEGEADGRGPPR